MSNDLNTIRAAKQNEVVTVATVGFYKLIILAVNVF